jgi:hypothetical protein
VLATAANFVPPMAGTVGQPTSVQFNPIEDRGDYMPTSMGHLIVWNSGQLGDQPPVFFALNGWAQEFVGDRAFRILGEENIPFANFGGLDLKRTGAQKPDTLFNQIKELRDTEDGIFLDDNDSLGVRLKLLHDRYNQTPTLTLYPTDFPNLPKEFTDDLDTHNIVTVKQRDGGEATATDSTSYLGTADAPVGVGEAKDEVNINVYDATEANLQQHANWWMRRGTVDMPRYPQVVIDLNASPHLVTAVNAVRPGEVMQIIGMRENVIRLYILGWTEVIGTHGRIITFNCKPNQQFDVGTYDDGVSRYNSKTTTNKTALNNVNNSVTFTMTDGNALWSTTSTPYDVFCSGERWTVNVMGAATGSGPYEQVATVVRSVNGVIKPIAAGEPISIATPGRYAL